MKRFIAVLSGLLFLPAFAEVAPVYYDEIVEYTDELIDEAEEQPVEEEATKPVATKKPVVVQRNVAGRSVSRAISTGTSTNSRVNTNTRAVASSPRNATQTPRGTVSRTTKTQTVSARPQTATRARATVTSRAAAGSTRTSSTSKPVTARVAATGSVISGARTNSGTPNMLTDSGEPLYISGTARVGTNRRSTTSRNASINIDTSPTLTKDDVAEAASEMDALAELTDYCKAQYAQCMDNYCNVLDDNQGRCSCSNNIKKYEKTELALEEASENFQDVVQKIKYIGLTASQIDSLFAETEAELAMKSSSDTSNLKNSLENIKKKIVDVSSSKSSTGLLDGLSFDMSGLLNMDFSSGFDLNSFLNTSTNVSNQRGTALFNTATQRCKTAVLNSCVSQGVDSKVITNSYDLAIDKQCVEYERSLNEANAEMRSNVRNAQNILQQARLMLAQQKNAYDLRGCVAALDECMQDEYVCGDDYELCLDPTGKYLANGEIVKGGMPGIAGGTSKNQDSINNETEIASWTSEGMYGLYSTWDYTTGSGVSAKTLNAWGKGASENLSGYINDQVDKWNGGVYKNSSSTESDSYIATYLLRRVGYVDDKDENQTYGMCANILKQCQNYTFDSDKKKYKPDNDVIRQYLALALTKIKLKQDTILADYAETCWSDVSSCLSTNNYDEDNQGSTASRTAINACRSEISTCMSVTGSYPKDNKTLDLSTMADWVNGNLDPDSYGQSSSDLSNQCPWRAIARIPGGSTGGAVWYTKTRDASSLYTELLLGNDSVEPFEVTRSDYLGGSNKYYTDGEREYRLKVKPIFNSSTGKCECPSISGREPVDKNGGTHSDSGVAAYNDINNAYHENMDSEYGCTYRIPQIEFVFGGNQTIKISAIKTSLETSTAFVPGVASSDAYWKCTWQHPDADKYNAIPEDERWPEIIKLKPGQQIANQNRAGTANSLKAGQFDPFFQPQLSSSAVNNNLRTVGTNKYYNISYDCTLVPDTKPYMIAYVVGEATKTTKYGTYSMPLPNCYKVNYVGGTAASNIVLLVKADECGATLNNLNSTLNFDKLPATDSSISAKLSDANLSCLADYGVVTDTVCYITKIPN